MKKTPPRTHIARLSEQAYNYFVSEVSRRKLARIKPDTVMGLIDELIIDERTRQLTREMEDLIMQDETE